MLLRERLQSEKPVQLVTVEETVDSEREKAYQDLKARVHYKVIDKLDLSSLDDGELAASEVELENAVKLVMAEENHPLTLDEQHKLIREVKNEVLGLGPLEPLLADPTIDDILVNRYDQVFVERRGLLEEVAVRFHDDRHLLKIIDKIASAVGRRIDESSPMVDARLADGSRVNAVIPPLSLKGPTLSIRKFAVKPLSADDLLRFGTLTAGSVTLLKAIIKARLNVLISGGTGTGKTTLLNVVSAFIPGNERIVTVEDSAELKLQQRHVVSMETRPPNIEGQGEITVRDLVRNSLRMRPDRIIVGEVRGGEALDMMQAMNTGHEGSLATIHANTPRDALTRLETMMTMAGLDIPVRSLTQQVASAINVVVHLNRLPDGKRKMVSLSEVTGMEGETLSMQEIFRFEQTGIDETGQVLGELKATGVRPAFAKRLIAHGIELPGSIFIPGSQVEEQYDLTG